MTDEPAFPILNQGSVFEGSSIKGGLSKRELAAFMAMQGFLSNSTWLEAVAKAGKGDPWMMIKDVSKLSVLQADALLAELGKNK